jgi:diguanylate cyclase (GGDEF)-like protein/PAS domain S-box-containing protein
MVDKKHELSKSQPSSSVENEVSQRVAENIDDMSREELHGLVAQFKAYQSDLEKQNEALSKSNAELTGIRDRYNALELDLKKITRAVEYSSSVVIITDLQGIIEYVNPKFTEITGYTRDEAMGQTPSFLRSDNTSDELYADLWENITSGKEWKGTFHNRKKDGSYYWARNLISGVKDEQGEMTHYVCIQENITQDHEANKQLSFQASHDALTGLTNRREFLYRCERILANFKEHEHEHAMCFMDLDQFELINDSCGHVAGYELLRQLGQVLKSVVRRRDTLARLNGDEFSVLIEHCSLDHAHRIATELLQAINDYEFYWEGKSFRVGVSIGLVPIISPIPSLTDLLSQADAACNMAKKAGRNRIHVYHAETPQLLKQQSELTYIARINEALNGRGFCLYSQLVESIDGRSSKSVELLLRMNDGDSGLILPGIFLPVAQRYDLIEKVDSWVINKAMDLLSENRDFLNHYDYVSINLADQSLTNDNILDLIITRLKDTGIAPDKICLELSEVIVISNLNAAIRFVTILKDLGCRFTLDNFGKGVSSFSYLKNLPVDYLKINGLFVKQMPNEPLNVVLVKSIHEIGQVMGIETVAEFVESEEIMNMAKTAGVNYAQGYGIHNPQPFEELLNGQVKLDQQD